MHFLRFFRYKTIHKSLAQKVKYSVCDILKQCILMLFVIILVSGCSVHKRVSMAQKSFEIGEYTQAAALYKKAYSKQKNKFLKGEYSFYMGECYRITNKPTKAASSYSKAVRYKYSNRDAQFYLAESYRKAGKIAKALPEYETYLKEVPADIRAQRGLASCLMVQKKPEKTRYQVEKVKRFRSRYSDYSPAYANNSYDYVIFSSMRTSAKKKLKNKITGQGTSSLYYSKLNAKGEWEEPELMDEPINVEGVDDGAPNISMDFKQLYYTRCMYDNDQPMGASIVLSQRTGGKWGEPATIQIGQDSVSIVIAHPAISPDGGSLYFVSDREGGYGGKDIWVSHKLGEAWGKPENLGSAINTPGNEEFPYVRMDGTLYFSSDTQIGYGGLDIFKAKINEKGEWEISNMGEPVNSEGDDFGIVFKGNKEEGLLSSSRGSTKGVDDIYHFIRPQLKFKLNGKIVNQNGEEVAGAYLRLIGSDGTVSKINAPTDGVFTVDLKPDTDYVFLIAAKGYLNQKINVSTVGEQNDKDFAFDVVMEKPIKRVP